jgi:hypothetical protein
MATKHRINPNTADSRSLEELPGIGKTLVEKIIASRPYIELDDLASVRGLGKSRLAQIKPYLSLEAQESAHLKSPIANGPDQNEAALRSSSVNEVVVTDGKSDPLIADVDSEVEQDDAKVASEHQEISAISQRTTSPKTFSRAAVLWIVAAMGLVSIIFSIASAVLTFYMINGSLDFGSVQTIQTIDGLVTNVEEDLLVLSSDVGQLSDRLNSLVGLDARMETVEGEVIGLEADIGSALSTVDLMQVDLNQLSLETAALSENVGRFELFVDGLRSLLTDLFE